MDTPPFVINKKGVAAVDRRLADERAAVEAILDEPRTPPHVAQAGRSYLDGGPEATPSGAAAVTVALATRIDYPEDISVLAPWADARVARPGLHFAVQAVVEHDLLVIRERARTDRRRHGAYFLAEGARGGHRHSSLAILLRVRAAVAAASEAGAAEIREALRVHR